VTARAIKSAAGGQPQKLDRYELIAEIAAGGMATVYLARLSGAGGFQRLFAIKRMHPHLAWEAEFVQMFLDEGRLAAHIHHPNVVPTLEVGVSDAGYYLVMEYIEGETLSGLVTAASSRNETVPPRVLARVLLDILNGLSAAHDLLDDDGQPLQIVHRDVSPQNVIVGIDGTSRITDFGVARAATRIASTRDGQLKGKLGYMAPEQARGEAIDRRADVFAVGVMLWEVLAGRRLFKPRAESGEAETLNRLMTAPIPALADLRGDIDRGVSDVAARALQREADARFPTCADFHDALESAMQRWKGVASTREVAAFLDSVSGQDLAAQRAAVKSWVGQTGSGKVAVGDETVPNFPSSVPSAPSKPQPPEASSGGAPAASTFTPAGPVGLRSNRNALVLGALGGMVLLSVPLVILLLVRGSPVPAPSAPPSLAAPQPSSALSSPASPDSAGSAASPATSGVPHESASAATPAPPLSGTRRSGVNQPGRSVPSGRVPEGPTDELENNPYR